MFSLFWENVRIALDSIKSQLLRTILTIVIIGIGIWALVGILSAVKALETTISGNFASMGANTFNIQQYEFTVQTNNSGEKEKINPVISYNNVREFLAKYEFPSTKTSLSFRGTSVAEVKYGSEKTDPEVQVYGVNENYLENTGTEIEQGRNFTIFDIQNNNKVCLIGSDFVKNIFKNESPINKTISIRGVKFKVVGLLESKGSTFGNNQDLKVLIPVQVARGIYTEPNINYNISIKVGDKQMMEAAQDEAIITFRNIRGLNPVEKNNFGIERSEDLINRIASITQYLEVAAWIISIITILGSSIALMNIMLVSVSERTREIGVRKALGAKRSTISTQFFIETIVIGQFGSILGIILGVLTGFGFAKAFEFDFTLPWTAMIWATIITFIVAIIAGSYPASKAAGLDPIESLRYE
ncbi:ABC-type antimicrobial peptide transport system, permease component [Aequorivita sublithincola DSM 14238]|uniref:ABC-type antimicrobial peptide transport system, permease component n=1 Tax=Aequorivita sublithincola (strain DSM 14238 / LMG 21431 / ACAM 643 / 9-3) TaxID=746697 RepID=I3YXZ3_AEQSU|nr:ABC transporter permease [Aequorivita sublithincola]AFL81861.1 ABC-type antimicrobial peptide transport system, permease component [Aequorivita sublithincola DSM 14238]